MEEAHEPSPFWDKDNEGSLYNAEVACKRYGVEPPVKK